MAELKQGRWVKIHEPGQRNFVENENVMDISIGTGRCQADATYTVRSHKKAAYWLAEYLKAADALQLVADEIMQTIQNAADNADREEDELAVSGEGWSCTLDKLGDGSFKVQLSWAVSETVTKKTKQKAKPKKEATVDAPETATETVS